MSQQASLAKSNANQADAASPFGQLLAATAPKQATSQNEQNDTSGSGDKHADNTSASQQDAKPDNSSGATQTSAQNTTSPAPAKKTDKADKSDDKTATKSDGKTADDGQNAAVGHQLVDQQATPPVPPSTQAPVSAAAGDNLAIGKIASAAQAGTPSGIPANAGVPNPAAPKPADAAAAQAAGAQQADDGQTDSLELQMSARALAAQAGSKPSAPSDITSETGATAISAADSQIAVNSAGAAQAGIAAKNAAKNAKSTGNAGQTGKGTDNQAAAALTGEAKSDIAQGAIDKGVTDKGDNNKADANKGGIARIHDAQNSAANDTAKDKADTANSAGPAESKTMSAQAAFDAAQAPAPKSAALPMQAANANIDISGIAPQPGQVSASTQQDIQVSAKPAPNLPALAVEIVARSQSGAKQFDIRLDPPELGRVDIRLSIDATGKASAHLSADQPHTLTLLQNDASVLTRALRDAGLDVSQNGLNFSLRQQAENNSGNAGDNGRRGNSRAFSLTATADIDATAAASAYRGVANGRLDIRV